MHVEADSGHPPAVAEFATLHVGEDHEWAYMSEPQRLAHQFGADLLRDAYREAVRALAERYDPRTLRDAAEASAKLAEQRRLAAWAAEEAAWRADMCERHGLDAATLTRSGGQWLVRGNDGMPHVLDVMRRSLWPAQRPEHVGPGPGLEGLPDGCRKWRPVAECHGATRRWRLRETP